MFGLLLIRELKHYKTWDFAEPPKMCILENPRNTSISTKPEIQKNRRVALELVRELSTTERGFFRPPKMCILEILGKQVFRQRQTSRKNRRFCPRTHQSAEHYKTWDFAEPPRYAFWEHPKNTRFSTKPEPPSLHFGKS